MSDNIFISFGSSTGFENLAYLQFIENKCNTPLLHIATIWLILTAISKTFRNYLSYCENVLQLA